MEEWCSMMLVSTIVLSWLDMLGRIAYYTREQFSNRSIGCISFNHLDELVNSSGGSASSKDNCITFRGIDSVSEDVSGFVPEHGRLQGRHCGLGVCVGIVRQDLTLNKVFDEGNGLAGCNVVMVEDASVSERSRKFGISTNDGLTNIDCHFVSPFIRFVKSGSRKWNIRSFFVKLSKLWRCSST